MKTLIAAWCLALTMGSMVEAQTLGAISYEIDDWAYVPVITSGDVEAIVALRIVDSTSPINALWCEQAADGSWSSKAWESTFPEEVASYVLDYVGASINDDSLDDMMYMWPIELDPATLADFISNPVQPKPFGDGVYIGDALESVVFDYPQVLEPLAQTGYPALSSISGSTITTGTFGGVGIDPQPTPGGGCVTASELLDVLTAAFGASQTDGQLVDQVFEVEYGLANEGCGGGCTVRTRVTASTAWVYTCGIWTSTGFTQGQTECVFHFSRPVTGTRTRTLTHTFANCTTATCLQTNTRTGTQTANTLTVHAIGVLCAGPGPTPTGVVCKCPSIFFINLCTTSGWAPPCVWGTGGGGGG